MNESNVPQANLDFPDQTQACFQMVILFATRTSSHHQKYPPEENF